MTSAGKSNTITVHRCLRETSGMALGNSLSNYKVTGVALTPAEGVITTDDDMG